MKVRVSYAVSVSDEYRRAINRFYGREGMADREEIRRWFEQFGGSMDDDVMFDHGDEATEWADAGRTARAEEEEGS